jgi:hypothetical protein
MGKEVFQVGALAFKKSQYIEGTIHFRRLKAGFVKGLPYLLRLGKCIFHRVCDKQGDDSSDYDSRGVPVWQRYRAVTWKSSRPRGRPPRLGGIWRCCGRCLFVSEKTGRFRVRAI